ncbi:complex I intermediate-associated protein 30, mitochondrial-like isoform X2 [Macrobrachium nipponense]|uniref:complex I intermediate-associated protein 30, mitochondrial-like isoform X2 n=1 Tax=Macrobrachium nipponense TaxID=159736 RepID=UPI0030C88BF3
MIRGIPHLLLPSNLCTTSLGTGLCRTIYSFSTYDSFKFSRSLKARYLQPSRIQVARVLNNDQNNAQSVRYISTTPVHWMFWERDRKGGYGSKEKHSKKEMIRAGLKELRGDMDKMWVLKENKDLEEWVITCDQDHNEGFSSGTVTLSPTGHGLFSGELSTQVPKDGVIKKAGYVNMRSLRPRKSFKRETYLDWSEYNTLELRVRGDGRSYLINISTAGYFDITWNDIYSYALYTRGGPHWQLTRIPFSKFFLSSKGRIQDKQCAIPLDRIVSFGISAVDKINAPFRLEIDYVGVYCDPDHTEEFAYEMYKLPKFYIY